MRSLQSSHHAGAALALVLATTLVPAVAHAGSWQPLADGGEIVLPYGVRYASGTHRGVDLAAGRGEPVFAPEAGTVRFAGAVPADGGGTCIAVTLELASGLRLSFMPLESARVTAGDAVAADQALGALASSGDDSSPDAHLHLSVRRGEQYLDPTSLLAVSRPPAADAAEPATPAVWSAPVSYDAGRGLSAPVVAASEVMVRAAATVPSGRLVAVPSAARLVASSGVPVPTTLDPARLWDVEGGSTSRIALLSAVDARVLLLGTLAAVATALAAARRRAAHLVR